MSVPGVKDGQAVLHAIGQTGQLYFRPALCYAPPYQAPKKTSKAAPTTTPPTSAQRLPGTYQLLTTNLGVTARTPPRGPATASNDTVDRPPSLAAYHHDQHRPTIRPRTTRCSCRASTAIGLPRYLLGPAELTGHAVKKAVAQQTQLGQWVVNMHAHPAGLTGWDTMAKKYFHEMIGIELDGVVQSAPHHPAQPRHLHDVRRATVQISGELHRRPRPRTWPWPSTTAPCRSG